MNFITEKLLYRINVEANTEKFLTAKESFSVNDYKLSLASWQNTNYQVNASTQTWQFQYNDGRVAYKIMCLEHSSLNIFQQEKVITYVKSNGDYNLALAPDEDKDEQYWLPIALESGNYLLVNYKDNTLVMTLKDSDISEEYSQFILEKLTDSDSPNRKYQEFAIASIELFSKQERKFEDGVFQIETVLSQNKVLDVLATSEIILWDTHGGNNQRWNFTYSTEKKAYRISSLSYPNKYLIWDESTNYASVSQDINDDNSFWNLEICGDSKYIFKNKKNKNMLLSVENDGTENFTRICIESSRNAERQKFKLRRIV